MISSGSQDEELLVSNRSVNIIVHYCKKKGIAQHVLLSHLGYPEEYLTNPDHWIPLPIFHQIAKRARQALDDDPTIFYEMGLTATREGKLGMLEIIKRMVGAIFADPIILFKKVPEYNNYFNKTKDISVIRSSENSAIFKVSFHSGIDPVYDFNSGPLVKGVIASVPCVWNLPPANVTEVLLQYDVVRLLREHCSLFAELKDNTLLIEGQIYGRVVQLIPEQIGDKFYYMGKYKETHDMVAPHGILITKSFYYRRYPLLLTGQIYNAPYFILTANWPKTSFTQRLGHLLPVPFIRAGAYLHELEQKTTYFQTYARELEESIKERNKIILEEKHEVERLKNELNRILSSHLPDDLVRAMTTHKLIPKRNSGIVMFADLVGFSKRVHTTQNFAELLKELNRYFDIGKAVIKSRKGWVYKYLGDGIMAVFGGYQDHEDYPLLGRGAIEAAQKIIRMVNEMGWDIRIGIEYGDFIAGEIGPEGERIWDFLGETVNFAARLGQNCEPNEILLGPNILRLLQQSLSVNEKTVHLKGLGEQTVYSFIGFYHANEAVTPPVENSL